MPTTLPPTSWDRRVPSPLPPAQGSPPRSRAPNRVIIESDGFDLTSLAVSPLRAASVPPERRFDTSGVVGSFTGRAWSGPSPDDIRRQMEAIRARQAEYDRLHALPRRVPDRTWDADAFAAHLDDVQGDASGAKRDAAMRLALVDAMARQKAQRLHGSWTKHVYEPIASEIARGVDAQYPAHRAARRDAFESFLRASDAGGKATRTTAGNVFLDSTPGLGGAASARSYNPFELASSTVRARVSVRDPLKVLLDKSAREAALFRGGAGGGAGPSPRRRSASTGIAGPRSIMEKDPSRLPAQQWTRGHFETLFHGHFEALEERAGGAFTMAFAGKDTESNVRFDDFTPTASLPRDTRGRLVDVDAEFPVGKRCVKGGGLHHEGDGYLFHHRAPVETALATVAHRVHTRVYDGNDARDVVHSDGPLLDMVRTSVMAGAK